MTRHGPVLAALGCLLALESTAHAQAVGFVPVVNSFPSGVTLPVTPVVSADRRYVRMTLNPMFTDLIGFDTYSVPAAVSGGGIGGAGGGAGGGFGAGGGGFGGAFRSVAVPGGTFMAGMNGVVTEEQAYALQASQSYPYDSPNASAMLSGAAGYPVRPQLRANPGPSDTPRSRPTRKPSRSSRTKKTPTTVAAKRR